jgi:hypothetical protein
MGATTFLPHPTGDSPTPTSPPEVFEKHRTRSQHDSTVSPSAGNDGVSDIEKTLANEDDKRMRKAIREHKKDTKPEILIKHAEINKQRGRDALRRLESLGEYSGFSRKRPTKWNQRRRDD